MWELNKVWHVHEFLNCKVLLVGETGNIPEVNIERVGRPT